MKHKINVNPIEMAGILAALTAYNLPNLRDILAARFMAADPANDGPEVYIIRWNARGEESGDR